MPKARDGTSFDPVTCRRPGGYWVGPKGNQMRFADHGDALAYLLSLPFFEQRWRRPNSKGNWGIVRAV